jgi:hypothetical protein
MAGNRRCWEISVSLPAGDARNGTPSVMIISIIIISIIIMKFYGRERELRLMEHLYAGAPSFLVVTGRRRVGKTELIKEFCRGKPALYFYVDANKRASGPLWMSSGG